jgi:CRP/FNR family cyclic AMP-dependent transcriptional regulator
MATGEPIFDPRAFHAKHGGVTIFEYGENRVIYSQGDASDSIYFIQKGKVALTVLSEQGKEGVIAVLGTGDFCGEGCQVGQSLRDSTVTTMTDCVVARLNCATVARALHADLSFTELFVSHLLVRNFQLKEDLIDQLFNSSERRLARVLLSLSNYEKDRRENLLIPKINQHTLAKMVGTTRSRVNYFMNKFRRLGLIDYNGHHNGHHDSHITVHGALLNVALRDRSQIDAE